jgi:hypothetical protein
VPGGSMIPRFYPTICIRVIRGQKKINQQIHESQKKAAYEHKKTRIRTRMLR